MVSIMVSIMTPGTIPRAGLAPSAELNRRHKSTSASASIIPVAEPL
jgi:hypothetical protein